MYCCVTHSCKTATILLYLTMLWVRNSCVPCALNGISWWYLAAVWADLDGSGQLYSYIWPLGRLNWVLLSLCAGSGLCHMVSPLEYLDILCAASKWRCMLPVFYGLSPEMNLALLPLYSIHHSSNRAHLESRGLDRQLTTWWEARQRICHYFEFAVKI